VAINRLDTVDFSLLYKHGSRQATFLTWIFSTPLETINRTVVKRSLEKSMTSTRSSGCAFFAAPPGGYQLGSIHRYFVPVYVLLRESAATKTRPTSAASSSQSTRKGPPFAARTIAVRDRNPIRSIASNSGSGFRLSIYYSAFHYIIRNSSKSSKNI
jgi:hypothetical protein